jgi:hypothetical protein
MAGKRLALIVATDEYLDPGLGKLRAPARDAEALAGVLSDPELGDFQVDVLRNATSSAISERVETLLVGAVPDDLIVMHFSCHGIKDDSGELYLAATNTRPGLLASTAVDASLVNRLIRRSRAQRAVLFLDCCFGGAFERGVVSRAAGVIDVADQFHVQDGPSDGGRGRVVITASNAMEFAFEGTDLADSIATQPSIFTGALVEGLATGAADRDQDGLVSLGELYDFVFDRVRKATPNQTPGKWEFGLQGELVLAKNPARIVVPAPLPPDLIELIEHPFAPTRLGTIDVLVRFAEGTDLPIAAAAHAVLEQLADDDSRAVAQRASAALLETSLRLSATDVDLGMVAIGADATAEVSLGGVPLVTASQLVSSSPQTSARRVDRTIHIRADTSSSGAIDGIISVSGPAGSASIHVVGLVTGKADAGRKSKSRREPVKASLSSPAGAAGAPPANVSRPAPAAPVSAPADVMTPVASTPEDATEKSGWTTRRRTARRLLERGWLTGHVQTVIGAELGGIGVWLLRPVDGMGVGLGIDGDTANSLSTIPIWLAAIIGSAIVLRWAGPPGTRKSVAALALLYPVFFGLVKSSLWPGFANLVVISLAIALIALTAATVVRLKRPGIAS